MEWYKNHESLSWAILVASLALSIGGILAAPLIVVYVPEDYFLEGAPRLSAWRDHHPIVRWTVFVLKNTLGAILVVAGVVLSLPLIPGPGIVLLLLGLSLLNFPGKRTLERKLVSRPRILRQINAWRAKAGRPPLRL